MVQLRSYLVPADNSGAKKLMIIGVPGKVGKIATLGDIVLCVVKGADPNGAVKDHDKVKVLIVRTKKEVGRFDGTYIRFDDNAGVVIDKQGMPLGTRVLGPVAREVKEAGFHKIASLCQEVV